jgi:RNA polymerase sigma-70 factor (ECF subfamily)
MDKTEPGPPGNWRFPTTHWSCIADAGSLDRSRAREALAGLCEVYWYPIYAFIRRRGYSSEDALDLVQEYFARLLEKDVIASADPDRGRFRTFLMTDCSHFLSHHAPGPRRGSGEEAARSSRSTPGTRRTGSLANRPTA